MRLPRSRFGWRVTLPLIVLWALACLWALSLMDVPIYGPVWPGHP